jgi:hypothetical protein
LIAFVVRRAEMSLRDVKALDVEEFFILYQCIEEESKKKA